MPDLVYRTTEGNPFFTDEVLRGLIERGDLFRRDGVWDRLDIDEIEVPESVRDAIGERLSRLDEDVQSVLAVASVLGQTFGFDDIASLGEQSEDLLERALEVAIEAGLLRSMGGESYTFNHVLTQQTLYEELPPRRRRRLHLAAGAAMENRSPPGRELRAAEIAWHFLEAGEPARALPHALAAGDQAERRFAHLEAEQHFRTAVDLARESGDQAQEAVSLERLGGVLRIESDHAEALDQLEAASLLLAEAADVEGEIRLTAQIALTHAERGTIREGVERVEQLLNKVSEAAPSSALAAIYAALARLYYFGNHQRKSLMAAERAVELARAVSDERILVQAEVRRAAALYLLGHLDEALPSAQGAYQLANRMGDRDSACRALHTISAVHMVKGELVESERFRRLMLAVAEEMDDPNQVAFATANLGLTLIYRGSWTEARSVLQNFAAMGERLGSTWYSTYGATFFAYLEFMQGDTEDAARLRDGATSTEAHSGDPFIQALWAEQEIRTGDPSAAIERLRASFQREEVIIADSIGWAVLAWAQQEAGLPVAEATARRGLEVNEECPHVLHHTDVLRVLAVILRESGKLDESESRFEEGAMLASSIPYPFSEARIRHEWAKLLIARKEKDSARQQLERALAIFQHLGAAPDRERTELALEGLEGKGIL
ncbi:MAG TPA: hypothetical protein DEV93_06265 [Chloroflexi bacterium]|nr:hypothetical protein [Chloroflexota bacterium]